MSSEDHKNLLRVISEYLPEAGAALGADSDDVQTIRDTIGATFKVSNPGGGVLPADATLLSVFMKGLEALNISLDTSSSENPWASNSDAGKDAKDPVEDSPVFLKFLENVTKKGYFNDAKEGSDEYNRRYQKVLAKFKSRMDAKKAPSSGSNDGKASSGDGLKKAEDSVAKVEAADKEKAAGNASLKMGDYETACEKYKKALSISPNGPSSHIYHCNLAAALSHLGKHEDAAAACVEAIALKSDYSKAYSRLGYARAQMKQYEQAKVAYEKALEFDPSSDSTRSALKNVSAKLSKKSGNATPSAPANGGGMPGMPPPGQGGMPDLSNLQQMMQGMGMGGGGGGLPAGGLAGIMNNPAFMQMAQNMMQNPQMMQMAQNMMQDPNAMAQAQQMMQGMGGGGMPDMSAMQNMMAGLNGGAQQQPGSSDGSGPTFEDAPDIN